ncbi:MAG: SH3 domain-containing protein [Dehalococcoidia bacterium]|nr:SH3 domain-containing protein [Dehalococcoidia bacterium]
MARRRVVALLLLVPLLLASPSAALTAGLPPTPDAGPAPVAALTPGSSATVKADGDCLHIREAPALKAKQLTCLPEGAVVQILDGTQSADGYTWRKVQSGAIVGWAAEQFLQPADASTGACPASTAAPAQQVSTTTRGFTGGEVPAAGGFGLVVWRGGSTDDIATTAASGGCDLSAVWVTNPTGEFVVYIYGAPDVVNQPWLTRFSAGQVPAGTAVLIVCEGPTASALSTSATAQGGAGGPDAAASTVEASAVTAAAPAIAAKTALVLDGASGKTLFDKDAHLPLPPASLTKMVTAILAIEQGDLDAWVKTDVDSRQMAGSSLMGLLPGDCFQLRDLVYGLLLPSGNDAALAIARHIAGSDDAFVDQMNAFLTRLGLKDSHFVNPHGLDAAGHVMSAYDLAQVAKYGMSLPVFARVVSTPQWTAKGSRTINLPNVNGFLSSYPGADGVKTGFTDAAGRTLVASATKNGRRIFVVLLNDDGRYDDAAKLMDWAFQNTN